MCERLQQRPVHRRTVRDRKCRRCRSIGSRLQGRDRPVERDEVTMLGARVIQYHGIHLNPRVCFEAPDFLARSDPQLRSDSEAPQQPPQNQRPLQTVRWEKKICAATSSIRAMTCADSLCDAPCKGAITFGDGLSQCQHILPPAKAS